MARSNLFMVEIYSPGSADDVWVSFSSPVAPAAITRGDIVNPGTWPGTRSPMKVLRVVNVEHIVWEAEDVLKHKVCIFTEEVEGTRELRTRS